MAYARMLRGGRNAVFTGRRLNCRLPRATVAPAGIAPDMVTRLNTTLVNIVGEKETQSFLVAQGLEPEASTPEELRRIIAVEIPKFARIVKAAGIRPE